MHRGAVFCLQPELNSQVAKTPNYIISPPASQARCGGHLTAAGLGSIQADTVTIVPFHLGHSEFPQQEMEHKQKSFKNIPDMNQQNP